jgi:ribosomal protein S18 acetylase RimI-like enzyme
LVDPSVQTGADVRIRCAAPDDVEAIAEFQTTCWREAYAGLVPQDYLDRVTVTDRVRRWRHRLATGERQIALALAADYLVGVISWSPTGPTEPSTELQSLYVGADHRGRGVAQALVSYAIGDRPARLWVFEGNHRAQAFYAKLGFVVDGGRMVDPDTGLLELRLVRP